MTAVTLTAHQLGAGLDLALVDVDSPLWPVVALEAAHRAAQDRPPAPALDGALADAVRVLLRPTHVVVLSEYTADRVAVSTLYVADGSFVAFQQTGDDAFVVEGPQPLAELGSRLAAELPAGGSPFVATVPWAAYVTLSAWMDVYRSTWALAEVVPAVARIEPGDLDAAVMDSDHGLALGLGTLAGMEAEAVRLDADPGYRAWALERLTGTDILHVEPEGLALGATGRHLGAMASSTKFWSLAVTRSDGSWGRVVDLAAGDGPLMVVADADPVVEPYVVLTRPDPATLPADLAALLVAERPLAAHYPAVAPELAAARPMRACGGCRAGLVEGSTSCPVCGWTPADGEQWVTVEEPTNCDTADGVMDLWPGIAYHLNERKADWILLEAPDGRAGWVAAEVVQPL